MSSISKTGFFSENIESPEESGWTKYFEDFFNNHRSSSSISSVVHCSSSLVSDAASSKLAANKVANDNSYEQTQEQFSANKNVSCRSSHFKKRRKAKVANEVVDDELEDTASSPLINSFKEKGRSSERKELGMKGRDSEVTELKKKGLCLVPFSMAVDYLA